MEWISVNDSMPDIDVTVITYDGLGYIELLKYTGDYWARKAWPIGYNPTHWMPIPPAPQTRGQ